MHKIYIYINHFLCACMRIKNEQYEILLYGKTSYRYNNILLLGHVIIEIMYEPYEPDIEFVEAIDNSELEVNSTALLSDIHHEELFLPCPVYTMSTGMDNKIVSHKDDGYAFFPVLRPELLKYYHEQVGVHWVPADIDMRQDRQDFDALEPDIRVFVEGILAFFVPSDGIVNENIFRNFQEDTSFWKEARAFYAAQAFMETIHSEMYSLMAQTLIRDPVKLNDIYNSISTYPAVERISEFMRKYMNRSLPLADRIIAFACVEGILFTSAFAAIYWLKKRNVLRGFCKANEFIARDEGIHTKFAVALYLLASSEGKLAPATYSRAYEIIDEAVNVNEQFIKEILKVDKIGMSADELVLYTKCTADTLLVSIGHDKLYNVTNPFDWMAIISLPNKTNFFEDKVSEYTQQTENEFIFDEDAYF